MLNCMMMMTKHKVKLGDICIFNYGKSLVANKRIVGNVPVYSSAGIIGYHNEPLVNTPGIIIGRKGTVGTVYYSPVPFYCIDTAYYIIPNESIYNLQYLYYQLKSLKLNKLNEDSAVPGLNRFAAYAQEISLPPLAEQKRIADILSAIDDKIELNRRINANLEQQAQALYKSWFVDFEPFGGKMPEDWKEGRLEDIGEVVGGGTPSKSISDYYTSNGIAWITPKDLSLTHAKFTSKGEIDITELGYVNSSAKLMPRGSILFSSRAPIGYISIAKNDVCTNQGFKSVIPYNGCTAYIYYYLLANTLNIEAQASGSTFKEASGTLMKSLDILIPDDITLAKFEHTMHPFLEQQELIEEQNYDLSNLRDTLLPRLMKGEY